MGGGVSIANKTKLNFRFHNPNTVEETANTLAKIMIEVNRIKLEKMIQEEAMGQIHKQNNERGGHSR